MPVRGEFRAQGDDGKQYRVIVRTAAIELSSTADSEPPITRAPELFTSDGLLVVDTEEGTYKVLETGVILTAED